MPSKLSAVLAALAALAVLAVPATASAQSADEQAVYALANGCFTVGGQPVSFKATGLGTFLLTAPDGQLLGAGGAAGGPEAAGPATEWKVTRSGATFTLTQETTTRTEALTKASGCRFYPEAELNATGTPVRTRNADGTLNGFADTHLHITADMRAGGAVLGGEPFDRFGIVKALGQDAVDHGADGSGDVTGNLLRDGVPFGTHDVGGWPAFKGWPTAGTNTHEQLYYRWLERAHLAGLRLVVAELVEDSIICNIEPRKRYSCDETTAIRGQMARLRALQDYVDAQSGGPGRGWLRIVTSPAQARRAVGAGQLAVVVGVESSFPLDCHAEGSERCSTAQVDRRLDGLYRLGIRSLFVAHWADNGFAGAAVEGGVKGKFINAMQRVETGRWFDVERCADRSQGEEVVALAKLEVDVLSDFFPKTKMLKTAKAPTYGKGRFCNARGLTKLGGHLVRRMMRKGMLIEMDHMSEKARRAVLKIAEQERYPVVSGHSDTGGHWTRSELRRLTALGGIASQRLDAPAALARAIAGRRAYRSPRRFFGVGLGSDTGGFASLPGKGAATYPFTLNGVTFDRQVTGERTFDFAVDGMAHYGLLPELLADMQRRPQGKTASALLMRSVESYVRMWELAERRR